MNISALVVKKDARIYALHIGLIVGGCLLVWQKVITWPQLLGALTLAGLFPAAIGEEKAAAAHGETQPPARLPVVRMDSDHPGDL